MKHIQIKCKYKSPGKDSYHNVDIPLPQST